MVSGLWTLYCWTARWRVPGSCGGRERVTSTVLGLSGAGLKVCSLAPPKAELGAGSSFTVSRQAVPVAERRTCWSLPAMRGSVERSFQSLLGVCSVAVAAAAAAGLASSFASLEEAEVDRDSRGSGLRAGEWARTRPPWNASGVRGTSVSLPALSRWRTRSWAKAVENTSGAPSTGRTMEGLRRQVTTLGSAGRRGGGTAAWMAGRPMTMTDLGSWKEGGVLRRRLRASSLGKEMAGMYWYLAVCRPLMRRTRSTTAPT